MDETTEPEGRDRLSELPDSLILSILSFLPMRYVVRTTFLSKRWKDLWTAVPCLDFWDIYLSFIQGALAKWRGAKIMNFTLCFFENFPSTSEILNSWLLVPIEKRVEELYVNLGPHIDWKYSPPQLLYSSSSITKLSLSYCDLRIEENVLWNRLKSLAIEHPIYLSQENLNRILSGSPLLEELMLLSVELTEDLNIRSSSLKKLKIGKDKNYCPRTVVKEELGIWGPNLSSLEISGCVYGNCLVDAPCLSDVVLRLDDISNFPHLEIFYQLFRGFSSVEKVTLSELSIQLLLWLSLNDMAVQFSNTKFLKLYAGEPYDILRVLEMFPQLKMLDVELDQEYWIEMESENIEIQSENNRFYSFETESFIGCRPSLPKLKTVEISWSEFDSTIILAIEVVLGNAELLEKMVFRPKSYHGWGNRKRWLNAKKKVVSMKRASPTAEVFIIRGRIP